MQPVGPAAARTLEVDPNVECTCSGRFTVTQWGAHAASHVGKAGCSAIIHLRPLIRDRGNGAMQLLKDCGRKRMRC